MANKFMYVKLVRKWSRFNVGEVIRFGWNKGQSRVDKGFGVVVPKQPAVNGPEPEDEARDKAEAEAKAIAKAEAEAKAKAKAEAKAKAKAETAMNEPDVETADARPDVVLNKKQKGRRS